MKKFIVELHVWIMPFFIFGQVPEDSLLHMIRNSSSDSARIPAAMDLVSAYQLKPLMSYINNYKLRGI